MQQAPLDNLLGLDLSFATQPTVQTPQQVFLTSDKARGMELKGGFRRHNNEVQMVLTFTNKTMQNLSG